MPPVPRLSARQVERILRAHGFTLARSSGSHEQWTDAARHRVTLPRHGSRTLSVQTMASIIRQSGLPTESFK